MLSILNKLGKWTSGVAAVARPVFTSLLRHCCVTDSPVVRALVHGVVGGTVGTVVKWGIHKTPARTLSLL